MSRRVIGVVWMMLLVMGVMHVGAKSADAQDGTKKWEFVTDGPVPVYSTPAIGPDGTIYVGCTNNRVYALNPADGTKKWEFVTDGPVYSSLAIGADGTIFVTTSLGGGPIYALNPADGTKKWVYRGATSCYVSPAIGADGVLYFGGADGHVLALYAADGTKKWEFDTGYDRAGLQGHIAIGSDGTIYVGTGVIGPGQLYALNSDGTKKWESSVCSGGVIGSPAIGGDGTIYIGSWDRSACPTGISKLCALNSDGTKKWEFAAGLSFISPNYSFNFVGFPTIGGDGTIYVGSTNGRIYALSSADGTEKWQFAGARSEALFPAIGADGTLFVGIAGSTLYALNSTDGTKKWELPMESGPCFSPAIGSDGTIYVTNNNRLYAIGSSCGGLADSAWPKFSRDNRNSGCVPGVADVPPTAVAGPDQAIHAGQTVQLDGTNSLDDNTPTASLQFNWTITTKPSGSVAVLSDTASPSPTFIADQIGAYVVQLVVTDSIGQKSKPAQVTISSTNIPPTASAGLDQAGVVGRRINLDGSGSTDPNNDPLTFAWAFVTTPPGSTAVLQDANTPKPWFVPIVAGVYPAQLVVNDGFGHSPTASVTVTVITGQQYAENLVLKIIDLVAGMSPDVFKAPGHQKAILAQLNQVLSALQGGDIAHAKDKMNNLVVRTDGCVLRGTPDVSGPGMDWIVDCPSQSLVYKALQDALSVL